MKPADAAIEPLWRLVDSTRPWFGKERLRAPNELRVRELLAQVVDVGDYRALPHIVWLLGAEENGIVKIAAEKVAQLMPTDPTRLGRLDAGVRQQSLYWTPPWWPQNVRYPYPHLKPEQVSRVAKLGCPTAALGLLSFVPSGHAREAALCALAEMKDGSEVPFLLLRMNDWVPQLATRAATAMSVRATRGHIPSLARHLGLLDAIGGKRRVNHGPLFSHIDELWRSEAGTAAVLEVLRSKDSVQRRAAAKIFERIGASPRLLLEGLVSTDPVVRFRLASAAVRIADKVLATELVQRLNSDPSPALRRLAIDLVLKRTPESAQEILNDALLDRNFWVRQIARFHLSRGESQDFAQRYRDELKRGTHVIGAVEGLGETGATEDFELLRPFLTASTTAVRRSALRGLVQLAPAASRSLVLEALGDPRRGVSKMARELLRRRAVTVLDADLAQLLDNPLPHVRQNGLLVLSISSRWQALASALKCIRDDANEVRVVAQRILLRWNQLPPNLYTKPGVTLSEQIEAGAANLPMEFEGIRQTIAVALNKS